jgi:ubiquitin C-terminal hydrolase
MNPILVKGDEKVGEQKAVSLYELLKKFTTKEVMNNMKCGVTDEVSEHVKKLSILKLPVILILYLKRYSEE